jgi:hypothetical protein
MELWITELKNLFRGDKLFIDKYKNVDCSVNSFIAKHIEEFNKTLIGVSNGKEFEELKKAYAENKLLKYDNGYSIYDLTNVITNQVKMQDTLSQDLQDKLQSGSFFEADLNNYNKSFQNNYAVIIKCLDQIALLKIKANVDKTLSKEVTEDNLNKVEDFLNERNTKFNSLQKDCSQYIEKNGKLLDQNYKTTENSTKTPEQKKENSKALVKNGKSSYDVEKMLDTFNSFLPSFLQIKKKGDQHQNKNQDLSSDSDVQPQDVLPIGQDGFEITHNFDPDLNKL